MITLVLQTLFFTDDKCSLRIITDRLATTSGGFLFFSDNNIPVVISWSTALMYDWSEFDIVLESILYWILLTWCIILYLVMYWFKLFLYINIESWDWLDKRRLFELGRWSKFFRNALRLTSMIYHLWSEGEISWISKMPILIMKFHYLECRIWSRLYLNLFGVLEVHPLFHICW